MTRATKTDPFMSPTDIAEMFGVTPYTVRVWLREGQIEGAVQINKRWRIRRSAVEAFANQKHGDDSD